MCLPGQKAAPTEADGKIRFGSQEVNSSSRGESGMCYTDIVCAGARVDLMITCAVVLPRRGNTALLQMTEYV